MSHVLISAPLPETAAPKPSNVTFSVRTGLVWDFLLNPPCAPSFHQTYLYVLRPTPRSDSVPSEGHEESDSGSGPTSAVEEDGRPTGRRPSRVVIQVLLKVRPLSFHQNIQHEVESPCSGINFRRPSNLSGTEETCVHYPTHGPVLYQVN